MASCKMIFFITKNDSLSGLWGYMTSEVNWRCVAWFTRSSGGKRIFTKLVNEALDAALGREARDDS